MKLTDFENEVPATLLTKGREYFDEGRVIGLDALSTANWIAEVQGTQDYTVEVQLHKHTIKEWRCNCPYDLGPVCKHAVALFYAVAEARELTPGATPSQKKSPKKDKVAEIFRKATKKDLQGFITEQFRAERTLKNAFIAHFAELLDEDLDKKYRTIISNLHKAASDRHGFVDYYSATKLGRPLYELSQKAGQLLAQGNIMESLAISQALVELVSDFLYDIDDSNGYLGEVIDSAFATLHNIALEAPPQLKDQLFDYCLDQYPLEVYHGFSLQGGFLDVLLVVISNKNQEEEFFGLIEDQIAKAKQKTYGDYEVVSLITTKVGYLRESKQHQAADKCIDENLRYPKVRELRLKQLLEQKDYENAKKLCRKGMEIAQQDNHPGTEDQWQGKLLEIALLQRDIPEIRKLAEAQYFSNYGDMKYYRILKETYKEKEWPLQVEAFIDRIKGKNARGGQSEVNDLADIFIEEGYTDRLLKLLQINPGHISLVDAYAPYIQNAYPTETVALYADAVEEMATATGRPVYNEVARHLRTMQKIKGGREVVQNMVTDFRERYKMRRAMMEVLGEFLNA